jgi:hypothetical protein
MKRRRSEDDDNLEAEGRSSPSDASSPSRGEGNMADTEADAPSRRQSTELAISHTMHTVPESSSASQAIGPPPAKKKRTRTLTTPHQSAVLQALLAQVRWITNTSYLTKYWLLQVSLSNHSYARGSWSGDRTEREEGAGMLPWSITYNNSFT